jgi:hypothetical protein
VENLIALIGYKHQLPIVLGMFGKDNLEYLSEFDAKVFEASHKQIYYNKKLNSKIIFYNVEGDFLKEPNDFFKKFNRCVVVSEFPQSKLLDDKLFALNISWPNIKTVFMWQYGEVFEMDFIKRIKEVEYDLILSGSKRPGLQTQSNFYFDLLFTLRYFRYYIGYYYLEDLVNNIPLSKYDTNKPKLFSYSRTHGTGGWRNYILNSIQKIGNILSSKNSANDAYDLLYPKYKHFETINDYLYCNYNLIFETLNYANNYERFITEKTYKGLFFGKPIILVACSDTLNELKNMGFYLVNFDFLEKINNTQDVELSVTLFSEWLNKASDEEIEERYNQSLEKSIQNRHKLMEYLNDYSEMENIFKKLMN